MQILNHENWTERSLTYLCRSFDHLKKGEDYTNVKPVIHISILDYTLFSKHPEFFSTYMLMNVKNHFLYSDKLRLSVVDLTHINMATDEDREYHIDEWATLFTATTWEEIKMLAKTNKYINEAFETLYQVSAEDNIRMQCEAREEYYRIQRTEQKIKEKLQTSLANTLSQLEQAESQLEKTESQLEETELKLKEKDLQIQQLIEELNSLKSKI